MPVKYGFVAQNVIDEGKTSWNAIKEIQKWVKSRQDLPKYTNEQIASFLISCGNEIEATKSTIVAFHTLRNQIPEIFNKRDWTDPDLEKLSRTVNFCIFPKRTEEGYVIVYNTLIDTNFLNFDNLQHIKLIYMVFEAALYDYPPNGLILIADLKGMSVMHLTRLKLGLMKRCAHYMQTGLPVKLKNIHLINAPWFIEKVFGILKPMVSEQVYNQIVCHSTAQMETFSDNYIPSECLPLELGGKLPSIDVINKETLLKVQSLQSHFNAEEKQREEYSNNNNINI